MLRNLIFIIVLLFSVSTFAQEDQAKFEVNRSRCIGCAQCIPPCPTGAISLEKGRALIDSSKCISCGLCAKTCPVYAIKKQAVPEPEPQEIASTAESTVAETALVAQVIYEEKVKPRPSPKVEELKAQNETEPTEEIKIVPSLKPDKCISCGICARVCPEGAISMVEGKPVVDPDKCISCGKCVSRCPTEALELPKGE